MARLGVALKEELHGGHQSRVYRVNEVNSPAASDLVIKLIGVDPTRRDLAIARLRVRNEVAGIDDRVVPIVALAGRKLNRIGDALVAASPYIDGAPLDLTQRPDVERMARALARLHESLRLVRVELPPLEALRVGDQRATLTENHQLLHGDFGGGNVLADHDGRLWILDFDDCGYGPVEFELGNSLFMALFDTSASLNQPSAEYEQFRRWFLGAYQSAAEHPISEEVVDVAVNVRGAALRYWLHHLDEAPPGIRDASPTWHQKLGAFAGIMLR